MIGYIYKCTCLINNKVYIGQTTKPYLKRWNEHKRCYNKSYNANYKCKFYNALRKYGIENFKWEVIQIVDFVELKSLQKMLNNLEIYYINYYNSYEKGYNSTKGGDGCFRTRKKIKVFDEFGNLLNSFNSCFEASNYYKISMSNISANCNRNIKYSIYKDLKIIFRWDKDFVTDLDISELNTINRNRKINMFDVNGNYINTYSGTLEISERYNIPRHLIIRNCNKVSGFVQIEQKRYMFRYDNQDAPNQLDINRAKAIKSNPKCKVVAIDSVTNEQLGEYSTMKEAAKAFGIKCSGNISEVCAGKRKYAGTYNNHLIKWIKCL